MNYLNLSVIPFCLGLVACGGDSTSEDDKDPEQGEILEYSVLPYERPCVGEAQFLCLQIQDEDSDEVQNFYGSISGFDYEWGHHYTLSVERTPVENPPADGSSYRTELKEILSEEEDATGTLYHLERISLDEFTFTESDGQYSMLGKSFECSDTDECDALVALNNTGGMVDVTFEYLGEGAIRLQSWE